MRKRGREQARDAGEQNTAVPRLVAAAVLSLFLAGPGTTKVHVVDTRLCGFPLPLPLSGIVGTPICRLPG